jgi:APA family basic amino acid/polyamine antiporter
LTYVSVIIALFSAITVAAVVVLRVRQPDVSRPYRMPGCQWIAGLFVLAHIAIAVATLRERPVETLWGGMIVAIGIPAYFFWKNSLNLPPGRS